MYGTLTSKHIDFLAAPPAYDDRAPGGSIAHSMPIDSINIHGKVFINECDVRTSLAEPIQRKYGAPKSLKQSSENIKHFLGYSLVHQNYGWYLEPGAPTDKREQWFNNSQLAVTMSDLNDSFHKYTEQKNEFKTEIAVIWDKFGGFDTTFTIQGDSVSNHFSNPGSLQINEMLRMEANRIGAPVNFYLIEDLVNGFVPENIKLFIFVNTWGMTKELRTSLKTELMRRKAAEMWFYGSAYVDRTENVLSLDAMNDLMGMHFSVDDSWGKMEIELNSQGRNKFIELNEITGVPYRYRKTGLGLHSSFTPSVPSIDYYSPFFSVIDDAGTEMLGNYKNKGAIALAHKKTDDRDIYYSGSPFASCNILREIAKCAGVHIYLDSNDALYMNGDIMLLHAATSGEKSICFPDGKTRKLNMKKGKTEIFTIK